MSTLIGENATVLFQGDSITDACRNRRDPSSLGNGYPMLVAAWFSALFPEKRVRFLNRGISGDSTFDLVKRWQRDCLELRPEWVSILVGINDTWRRYDSRKVTGVEEFEENYRKLLEPVKNKLGARLIMLEPFVLPYPEDRK